MIDQENELIATLKQNAWVRIFLASAIFAILIYFLLTIEINAIRQYVKLLPTAAIIVSFLLLSFLNFFVIKRKILLKFVLYLGLFLDILLITIGAHFINNETFIFLTYLVLILSSSSASLKAGVFQAVLVSFFYPLLLALEYRQILVARFPLEGRFGQHYLLIAPSIAFTYFGSILVGTLADNLKKAKRKSELLAEQVQALYQKTKISSELIFENMEDGFLVLNQKGVIEKANPASANLLGLENLVGENLESLQKKIKTPFKDLLAGFEQKHFTQEVLIPEPIRRHLEVKTSLMTLGEEKNLILVLKDITTSWGLVYDSQTNQPIRTAIVRIFDKKTKKLLETRVTDEEGRFQFLVRPGEYFLQVTKQGYQFPSKEAGVYRGETIAIKEKKKGLINVKVPLDKMNNQ